MTARKRFLPPPPKPARPRRRRGAQPGNKNSLKTGSFTRDIRALKGDVWAHLRRSHELINEAERIMDDISRRRKERASGAVTPSLPCGSGLPLGHG